MICENCRFESDYSDAFCRKCGAGLSQDVAHNSPGGRLEEMSTSQLATVEVIEALPVVEAKPSRLSRLAGALKSEQGKKLVRGAALVAVGVGLELAAQAVSKLGQAQAGSSPSTALAPRLDPPSLFPSRPVIIESVTYQRIYTRKIIRRIQ